MFSVTKRVFLLYVLCKLLYEGGNQTKHNPTDISLCNLAEDEREPQRTIKLTERKSGNEGKKEEID